jgi:hypothetical protein
MRVQVLDILRDSDLDSDWEWDGMRDGTDV